MVPLAQAGVQLEKLVTIRLRLLDREIKVLFHFQVSREAFGTHSVQESEINRFTERSLRVGHLFRRYTEEGGCREPVNVCPLLIRLD